MALSVCFNARLRPLRSVRNVAVFAHKGTRSNDGFSWGDKRPGRSCGFFPEELGDISSLYSDESIIGDSSALVHDCTMHIKNFIYNRNIRKAHHLLDLMIEKDVLPNEDAYIALMKGYSRMRRNDAVFELLGDMDKRGVVPTEKTLRVLTNACTKTGDIGAALSFFDVMNTVYGVMPNIISYSLLLKSCVKRRNLEAAKSVLEHMESSEVSKNVVSLTTLINVYAVCCNKENARQYLKECKDMVKELDKDGVEANVLTFNTLLKLCARGCLMQEAFELLDEMKTRDLSPDVVTYATMIDGISKNETLSTEEALRISSSIVAEMKKEGLRLDAHAYSVLMHLAFKTRDLNRAVGLFHEMKELGIRPTVVTYGSMIKYYTKLGDRSTGDEYLKPCFDLLEECKNKGIKMDVQGFVSLLGACANVASLDTALKVWNKINEQGIKRTVSIYTATISVYISVRDMNGAVKLFVEMKRDGLKPNAIAIGTMIKCFEKLGDPSVGDEYLKPCLDLLEECEKYGIQVNGPGFVSLLSACANVANLDVALQLWSKIDEEGLEKTVFLYNAMINVYISVKDMNGAVKLFTQMKSEGVRPNVVTYGTMIKCYKKLGDPSTGDAYLKPCLDLLRECEHHGIQIGESSFVSFLSACANVKNLDAALKVWKKAEEQGVAKDVFLYNSMINVYISVEDLAGAVNLFVEMKRKGLKPSEITYGTMIKCYEKLGDSSTGDAYLKPGFDLMNECEETGLLLSLEGFTSLLSACSNVANLEKALEVWTKMREAKTRLDAFVFAAMINVCLSADKIDKAFDFLDEMKISGVEPNEVTYTTFMSYFIKKKDVSGAQRAYNRMKDLGLQPDGESLKMLKALLVI